MPAYAYKARNPRGELMRGTLEGNDRAAVADQLMNTGMTPIEIVAAPVRAQAKGYVKGDDLWSRLTEEKVSHADMQLFTRQFHSLLKAGVPIMRSLGGLQQAATNKSFAAVLGDVRDSLDSGRDLSSSMGRHPRVFSEFFVAMIRVGEVTGRMNEILPRLYAHLEFDRNMRSQVKSALRYPTFVVLAMMVAIGVVTFFVIPAFSQMYAGFKAELPILTRVLLGFSGIMVAYWPQVLGLIVVLAVVTRMFIATPGGRYAWDKAKLKIPIVGKIVMKGTMARFARSFALATRSGVPLVQALSVVSRTVDNAYIESRLEQIRRGVERGESVVRTASIAGVFTPVVMQMIAVGEETGELPALMDEVAEMYENEVGYELKAFSSQIEPLLIGVMGVLVLILALGVFLPMWELGRVSIKKH